MSAYTKLPKESNSGINFVLIQDNLKQFQSKLKEYPKLPPSAKTSTAQQLGFICAAIDNELAKPRRTGEEKSRLEVLEKNYSELKKNFLAISSQETFEERRESDDFFAGIEERKSFAVTHEEIQQEEYLKRKKEIEDLHKDMLTVNEMFKDTAMMVKEQEDMLIEADKEVTNAVGQTGKAVGELHKADGYQRSAKKKMCVIMIIAMVVVVVVVGIVLGVTVL